MEQINETRNNSLDMIAGIFIIYMILSHICSWCSLTYVFDNVPSRILSFFMFWFFFKSGMFYRDKTCEEVLLGGGKRLIVPFVIFSMVGHLLQCIRMWQEGDYNWMHYVLSPIKSILLNGSTLGNYPLWFLLSLFAVQVIFNYLSKKVNVWLIVIMGFSIAYGLNVLGKNYPLYPLYFANVPLGIATYGIGYKMRNAQYRFKVFVVAFIVYIVLLSLCFSAIDFRVNQVIKGYYLTTCFYAISGCIVINNLFSYVKHRIRILEHIGRHSMNYYVMHWPIMIICAIVAGGATNGWHLFGFMFLSCLCVMPLIEFLVYNHHCQWIFGEKVR